MLTLQDGAVHNIMIMWLPHSIPAGMSAATTPPPPTPTRVGTGMSSHLNLLNSSYHSYYFKISAERYEQYTDSQCHRHRWSHGAIPWSSKHK